MNNIGDVQMGFRSVIPANSRRAFLDGFGRPSAGGVMAFLIVALALGGCVTQPPEKRDNVALRRTIHNAVPTSWRVAAASTEEVSPLAVSPDLREFVHSTVRSNAGAREQILALTDAIIDRDGVGLVYDPDATHTASEAFRSGIANCLGFSNLLVASARELGLNANFELVSDNLRWKRVGDALVGTQHMRVIGLIGARRMVFDFYPLPLESGYSVQQISDEDALAHHLNNLAVKSMQDGDDARAYALLSKAIEASPAIAFIWSNLGLLLSRHDLDLLAEAAFKEALLISPDGLNALSNLQRLYYAQGRHAEARELTDQLEVYRARNPYYHFELGEQAYEQGDYQQAVSHLKEAIARKKNEREFYILLSKSYEGLGLSKAALRASKKAESIDKPRAVSNSIRLSTTETGSRIPRN